jgi:hypothetical protein
LNSIATTLLNFGTSTLVVCKGEGLHFEDDDDPVKFEIEYSDQTSKCFKFDEETFCVHNAQTVILYGMEMGKFQEVDHVNIDNLPANARLIGSLNKNLYFFDRDTKKVYFF